MRAGMTGGWKPYEDEDFETGYKPRPVELSDEQRKVDGFLAVLGEGARFRRRAMQVLRDVRLTFAEWRVLRATFRASTELQEPVSQQLVARRAGMDEGSTQKAMRRLEERALVDVGLDTWGWSLRIFATEKGRALLEQAERLVAQAGR